HLRLVRRVRREQLATLEHRVDDSRDVVVVDAGAEERELPARVDVPRRELFEVARELLLRKRRLEVELPLEPNASWDVAKELRHGVDADRREHLLAVPLRQ